MSGGGASLRGTAFAKLCSSTAARLSRLRWLRIASEPRSVHFAPKLPPLPLCGAYPFVGYCGSFLNKLWYLCQNFAASRRAGVAACSLGGLLARSAVRGAVGAMSVARPTYIRGGSINSRTSFLVRRRPVGPS